MNRFLTSFINALKTGVFLAFLVALYGYLSLVFSNLEVRNDLQALAILWLIILAVYLVVGGLCAFIGGLIGALFIKSRRNAMFLPHQKSVSSTPLAPVIATFFGFWVVFTMTTLAMSISAAGFYPPHWLELMLLVVGEAVIGIILWKSAEKWRFLPVTFVTVCLIATPFIGYRRISRPEVSATIQKIKSAQNPTQNLIIFGLDGLTWRIMLPLIKAGRLPVTERLKAHGVYGDLMSYEPIESPQIWTTIATGHASAIHGIQAFFVFQIPFTKAFLRDFPPIVSIAESVTVPGSGDFLFKPVPVGSSLRRVRALWNVATDYAISSSIIGWWASWPAEPVKGALTTDRLVYSRFNALEAAQTLKEGQTYPESLLNKIYKFIKVPEDLSQSNVDRFMIEDINIAHPRITMAPFWQFQLAFTAGISYQKIASYLTQKYPTQLQAIYFEGIDSVSHFYYKALTPEHYNQVDKDYIRKYRHVIIEYYRYQDETMADILESQPECCVLLCSDHGFQHANRSAATYYLFEKFPTHSGLHHLRGAILLAGPKEIVERGLLRGADVYDVFPLSLYLLGLPLPEDIPGRLLRSAVNQKYLANNAVYKVNTFETIPRRGAEMIPSDADPAQVDNLRRLGYTD